MNKTCSTCRRLTPLSNVWSSAEYEGELKEAIRLLKFSRQRDMAKPFAQIINETIPHFAVNPIVVPVPTATSRARKRGYDQSALIAKELCNIRGYTMVEALRRTSQVRQVGSSKQTRQEQLRGAFRIVRSNLIANKPVLLIDDVTTTGFTLMEAASELKKANPKFIFAATVAYKK